MADFTRRDMLKSGAALGATVTGEGASAAVTVPVAAKPAGREKMLLDFGWRFHLGHAQDSAKDFGFGRGQRTFAKASGATPAATLEFDDSGWTEVNLPHDWAVVLPFDAGTPAVAGSPAQMEAFGNPRASHGFKPLGREYPETSIGWYRRSFDIPAADLGRRLSLTFDGVFRDCLVMFNGHIVASNASGYVPFEVDITDFANYGGRNILTLRVDATLGEGWFYEGAGIYRHVWLTKSDKLHFVDGGTVVRPEVRGRTAQISLSSEVFNDGDAARSCEVLFTLRDPQGHKLRTVRAAPAMVPPQTLHVAEANVVLDDPALWSIEAPNLYHLTAELVANGQVFDNEATHFGVRTVHFAGGQGFFLNGKPVKLKGTCNHQDHAGVGSALPDRIHAWRIEKLKAMGSNAYRASHNPPARELLDACDRLGMLVIDETRRMSSDEDGISQLTRMIRRDRNHPSIILWSIGNEEQSQQGNDLGARVAHSMKLVCNRLDPTRPIVAAMDKDWGNGITPVLDVVGFNYRTEQIDAFHARFPDKPVIGTETGSTVSTRGIYVRDEARGFVPAYDIEAPSWASTASAWWNIVAGRPFIGGGFIWTGFDYRGEPTPFNRWPNNTSQFGVMDTCGFPKDNYFYYKAWWDSAPLLHLFPHWNWPGKEGQTVKVWCHTNLERAELFLNGRSLGTRDVVPNNHIEWDVPYAPGVLEARGYKSGQLVLAAKRETAGAAAAIRLTSDRLSIGANGEDVAMLAAEIVDAQGRTVPDADATVMFHANGPGAVIGVGNGNPASLEPDKADSRKAFNGLCAAILQASKVPGVIRVEAVSPGLASGSVLVTAGPVKTRPFVP